MIEEACAEKETGGKITQKEFLRVNGIQRCWTVKQNRHGVARKREFDIGRFVARFRFCDSRGDGGEHASRTPLCA